LYTTNHRFLERESFTGAGRNGTSFNGSIAFSTPRLVEGVYSWRTGARAISDPPVPSSQTVRRQDGWGIHTPSMSGSLVDRLADRKRYLEEAQRAAFPAETQSGATSVERTSATDSGHLFCSHRTFRFPYRGILHYRRNSTEYYDGDVWGSVGAGLVNPSPYPLVPGESKGPLIVSDANRQAVANRYFAATAPDKNGATIATTLIELLRGDIPSLLRNFQDLMSGLKSVKNYLGSDFLNITFGWTPLIQEYANVIRVGMQLERVIYYESFRRRRQWDGPSVSGSSSDPISISMLSGPYGTQGTFPLTGENLGPGSGFGFNFTQELRWVASEDYHFTSKYVGMAKPGRRANSFTDQVNDVVKRLGLVDDPRLLWDLTPYSWLVDWFTSMGDSIANANVYSPVRGKYNVDYAYLTTQQIYSAQGSLIRPASPLNSSVKSLRISQADSSAISRTRWRNRATPFGFGTQLGSLSASQYAILVALGLAKSR